ncbi:RAMP superfamily CRISPR-associated protein [Thiospirillum jenense]|uniref:CRISPR-associated protein Csm5 n=1 Tax=Thiospirillum jenense TaxID=1653858 RepID=A0A839H7R2_9GAMM|nr:RAMP superfamily CRISPR-associated protein [Thiospirillum jenense]MBB1125595.1 CRISPR-associated protein Csm5 [Thiospirillum jenense]
MWRPILPGSSLKGAIRTALLDQVNGDASLQQVPDRRTGGMRRENNQELQQRLFDYRAGQFHLDPMRLVQLGDAADVRSADTLGTEIRYAVNRKRQPVLKDGRELASMAENLRQVIECIPPLRPRAFGGLLTLQELGKLTGAKLPDPDLRWRLTDIAAACNAFYRPQLDDELAQLASRGYLDTRWAQTVQQILTTHGAALAANRAFLLRLGFHSGAESVTLNGVRDIKIMQGKDPKTGKTRFEYLPVTKTIWLAAHDIQERRELLPFGWVLVETAAVGQALPSWPAELLTATADYSADERRWLQTITGRRAALQVALEQLRAREMAQLAAAEVAQREAEVAAAQLASLSAEARQLAQLRELLARDRAANVKQAGGELSNTLVELLKMAQDSWPAADCAALAALAEEIYAFVGWPSKQKKAARQAQIQALRGK